jgi:hypothetical protein
MPLFLFFLAFFGAHAFAQIAAVTAAPLTEFTFRTGILFPVLFFLRHIHKNIISKMCGACNRLEPRESYTWSRDKKCFPLLP